MITTVESRGRVGCSIQPRFSPTAIYADCSATGRCIFARRCRWSTRIDSSSFSSKMRQTSFPVPENYPMIDTPPGSPSNPSEAPAPSDPPKPSAQSTFLAWVLIAEVAIVACLLAGRRPTPTNNVASAASEWEYLDQADNDLRVTGGLRQRGQEKWELVTVKGEKALTYYFKRPKSAQNPQTARVVFAGNRWSGRIDANLAKQPCPAIKGPKSLAAFWHAFKQPGEPPPVDFSRDLVFAATTQAVTSTLSRYFTTMAT